MSFLVATGLHAAGFAALDAGWLLPSPQPQPVTCDCEVELVQVIPDTPAVPLPMAPAPVPEIIQNPEPPPAPEPPAPKIEPQPPPEPPALPEPEPMVEKPPEPKPEPPPPPKPERRPEPGPSLESKPKPVIHSPAPQRVATAKPATRTTADAHASAATGSASATSPQGTPASSLSGHGAGLVMALPSYLRNRPPQYPDKAKREKQEGVVVLDVEVSANGKVTRIAIAQSSGYALLDESALKTVRRWRFKPARIGNEPVDSRVQVPIRFRLDR